MEDQQEEEEERTGEAAAQLPATGREALLEGLSRDDKGLFDGLRSEVLAFLNRVGAFLLDKDDSASAAKQGMRNSQSLLSVWLQTFKVLTLLRCSSMKNIVDTQKYYNMCTNMNSTVVAKTVRRGIKMRTENFHAPLPAGKLSQSVPGKWGQILAQRNFWFGFDTSCTDVNNMGWIQYIVRVQQFAFHSTRIALQLNAPLRARYLLGIQQVGLMACHEYVNS